MTHIPAFSGKSLLAGPLGDWLLRPWFDGLALPMIAGWYLPLSRAWAAAIAAEGSLDAFTAALPDVSPDSRWLSWALKQTESLRSRHEEANARWLDAFFGGAAHDPARLLALEKSRHGAANRMMMARAMFLRYRRDVPLVAWDIRDPDEVARRHGARLDGTAPAFPARPDLPIEVSARFGDSDNDQYWLRYPSAGSDGGHAWAHVYEPNGVANPPTLIFMHGICMETEFWHGTADTVSDLGAQGLRVIALEGPWHGRRRRPGYYGGEPIFAMGPLGMIEMLQAWVAEVSTVVAWCRRGGSGSVGLAGVSLGALTSQLALSAAVSWPETCRPDAALLVVTSADLMATAVNGALPRAMGLMDRLKEHGWTFAEVERWRPLMEPGPAPAVAPGNIVMVLGTADTVTPIHGGVTLAERWAVPRDNVFVRQQGHFSASLGLYRDTAPLDRFAEILKRG